MARDFRGADVSQVRLIDYVLRYKWRYLSGAVVLLGASFVVMLPPVVVRQAIDAIGQGADSEELFRYGVMILGLAGIEGVLRFFARRLFSGTSRLLEYDMRTDFATRLIYLDQRFYLGANTGDLMARATNDLQRVRDLMGPSLLDLFRLPAMMLLGLALMLTIDVGLALIAVAYFPIVAGAIALLRTAMEARYRAVQDQFGDLSTRVQENISGIRTVKGYAQEEAEIAAFRRASQEMVSRSMSWARYSAGLAGLMGVAAGLSTVLVVWFGGHKVANGELTVGQFVQFIAYLGILANPVLSLGWTMSIVQQGTVGWKRVKEILLTRPAIVDPAGARPLEKVRGDVAFEHVTFGYGKRVVLRDFTLEVPAGTTLAVVGETGVGKSTLVNLLVRFYDPWEGRITLDGVDIREIPLAELRAAVGFVPQESFLFSEPLRENLAYARPDLEPAQIERALDTSQLSNDLQQFTEGLDTIVGERGVTMSGGQKQRAALARALVNLPPVLVLDDALAHVDAHTEEEILRRLKAVTERRTTFFIAHRTSTIADADRIVVLQDGGIVEQGTHQELLRQDGAYAAFHRRQLLEEDLHR